MKNNYEDFLGDVTFCVKSFNLEYGFRALKPSEVGIKGDDSNLIFIKNASIPEGLDIKFVANARNSRIYISENVSAKGTKINIRNEGNFVFIGKNSVLTKVAMSVVSKGDFVIVGEGVSVTSTSTWSTGLHSGKAGNGIIIGDHCLIASDTVIRPADGHPIIDLSTRQQVNISHSPVIVEPYCWLGQRAAVLKNVRVGACSILSFNAVVTKSCPKFSALGGVPAKARSIAGKMWLRNNSAEAKKIQSIYEDRFAECVTESCLLDES